MKLVTIQSLSAYTELQQKGYLITNQKFVNELKYGVSYNYIVENMSHIQNTYNAKYPLWAWVKYGRCSMPPKHKMLGFFTEGEEQVVRITFEKDVNSVLVNDFVKYSFLLTNEFIPKSYAEYLSFNNYLKSINVAKTDLLAVVRKDKFNTCRTDNNFINACNKIKESFSNIFNLQTNYLQATIWDIKLSDVVKVEFINKSECSKRKVSRDFRKEYIKYLKQLNNN